MTYGFRCPSCKKWFSTHGTVWTAKGKHLRVKHGWCELCEIYVTRDLICILKHKCRKDKQSCLLRYETRHMALNKHIKKDKHRWRKDIVIKEDPEYDEPHIQDIDRQCVKCGWNVNICEPHYKGNYNVIQSGISKLVYHPPPDKPDWEDFKDHEKPLKKDYKLGGEHYKDGMDYKRDLQSYESDIEDFKETLDDWKDEMSTHNHNTLEVYYGHNHYHPWCKNE